MANNQKRSLSRYRLPVLVLVIILVGAGVFLVVRNLIVDDKPGHVIPSQVDTPVAPSGDTLTTVDTETQLLIHLSEGQEQPQVAEPLPVATGEPLSNQDLQRVLARIHLDYGHHSLLRFVFRYRIHTRPRR